ncbi:MAG: hypothetical protein DRJ67_00610 [Thermoprotei archaeon]|nr:MAG: hypothetical protein DRJ67_00610 [Thermoprotei archaeon]
MRVKVVVEVDEASRKYKSSVIYLTSPSPFSGVRICVTLKPSIAITSCWPRWPDLIEGRRAVWVASSYSRDFGGRRLYSYGIRLELGGRARLPVVVRKWGRRGGLVELEVEGPEGLEALVGPLAPGYSILRARGRISTCPLQGRAYVFVREEGGLLSLALNVGLQGLLTGQLMYEPSPDELPFTLKVETLGPVEYEYSLVLRLADLLWTGA